MREAVWMRALPAGLQRAKRCGCGHCPPRSGVDAAQLPLWTLFRGWTSERVCFTQRGYVGAFNVAFCLGSRLLFAAWRQTGRLAVACVSIPPGRERHSCVLAVSVRLSAFVGSLRVWPFLYGDLDGVPGTRRTRLAARRLCVFAQAHWLCGVFRGEYVGGYAPPNLRQRVFDSLDSLHAAAGLR